MHRFLCFVLVFLLAAPPVWAKSSRPRAAVVEFENPYTPQTNLTSFGAEIEKNLHRNGFVLSDRQALGAGLSRVFQRKSNRDLGGIVARAKEDFYRFNLGRIRTTLGSEMRRIESGQCLPTDVDFVPQAWVVMGQVALAENRSGEAQNYFHQALVANPNLSLSDEEYAPQVTSLWAKTKQALDQEKSKKAQVTVVSNPDEADVTVDGVSVGKSPMKLGRLMPGRHLIGVSKEGYEPACAVVTADSKKSLKREIKLVAALSSAPPKIVTGKPLDQWAPALAHILGVDYLILVGQRKNARTMAASFQTYDTRLAQLMPLEMGSQETVRASANRWANLLNGAKNPSKQQLALIDKKGPDKKAIDKKAIDKKAADKKEDPSQKQVTLTDKSSPKKSGKKIALIAGGVLLLGAAAGAALALGGGSSGPQGPNVALDSGRP